MDSEQAAIVLAITVDDVQDLAAAIDADPDDLAPEELVAMAALLDAEDDDDDDDDEDD
jgi:hypothetical protein